MLCVTDLTGHAVRSLFEGSVNYKSLDQVPLTHRGGHARAHEGQLPRDLQQPPLVHRPLLQDQLGVVVLLLSRYLARK